MSHVTGTVQPFGPLTIGPDSGQAAASPNTWIAEITPANPPIGKIKFVILHFRNAVLPASNRVEVPLGYDTDIFTSADGAEFWTRPINVNAMPGGNATIKYITNGAANGGVILDKYGRGEQHAGEQDPTSISNCDPFLVDLDAASKYKEPNHYDPFWFCSPPPNWENLLCVTDTGDIRYKVARSVGMFVHADGDHLSTCSVTLIGPDLVVTAGHCMADPVEHVKSTSIIFNYEVACDGTILPGFAPFFFKAKEVVAQTFSGGVDYCVIRLKVPPGLPSIQMRHDIPAAGQQVFGVHHPNGAVKKLSLPHPAFDTVLSSDASNVRVHSNFHVSGGSSGSGLFDAAGRITGVLSNGNPCSGSALTYYPSASILQAIDTPPVTPVITRDVMLVIDRSGSMSLDGGSGRPKIEEARDAASLFIQLVRLDAGNKFGLVSFSTSAQLKSALITSTNPHKQTLIGTAPYSGGLVGSLAPGGSTTIGGGLKLAGANMPAAANPRSILLLTDGLQNTPPMIDAMDVQNAISGISLNAIGYGTDSSLDGALLNGLASAHSGSYVRADSNLKLEKFFAQAFGNIFEAGLLIDPEFELADGERTTKPYPFNVCGEDTITVVVGWDNLDTRLYIEVTSPLGAAILATTPGIDDATGRTWTFLRIPLPHGGERDGLWNVTVLRPGGGEFPPPAPATRYFINVIASGGPVLRQVHNATRFYTGDVINPLVSLGYPNGASIDEATVRVTITRPDSSIGNILSHEKLHTPPPDPDTIPARQFTMQQIERRTGQPVVKYTATSYELLNTPEHTRGSFEPGGLYGNTLKDVLTLEGDYTFHVVAVYGEDCVSSRELLWSAHVVASVDPTRTGFVVTDGGRGPDGKHTGTVTITPRDPYGNNVGPGRDIDVSGGSGTLVTGPVRDNGDGTYTVPVSWDPALGGPGVVVGQPGRPGVVITPKKPEEPPAEKKCTLCWGLLGLLLLLLLLLILMWACGKC
ncbi:MAG: hypothetical protein QOF14_5271 [Hyphomicrobiales bacterium]|jgi:hypothetical protein|nr:hypothetical protein [Hyphomicrobiales bacterium]